MTTTANPYTPRVLLEQVNKFPMEGVEALTAGEAQAWSEAGERTFTVANWLTLSVRTPADRPAGLSLHDCLMLDRIEADVASARWRTPTAQTSGWGGVKDCCPRAVDLLAGGGTPVEVVAAARALTIIADGGRGWGAHSWQRCMRDGCTAPVMAARLADALSRLSMPDVTVCLSAEMTFDEAMEHVGAGRDMDPVRVLAALA